MNMAHETSALRDEPHQGRVAEDDYQSFSAALGASARGRAFLQEYARRNRHADTAVVLAALDRLESVARSQKAAPEAERIRQDLRALLDTIHSARPQIDSSPGAIKAATLSALIEFVQARIEALVAPTGAPGANGFLSPVPEPEQPELPIPRPGASAQRSIALVHAITPPADSETAAARPAPDPFVLSLDPRIGPVLGPVLGPAFGEQAGHAPPAPPRSPHVIPEIDFIDSLFDQIDARAARQAAADKAAALMLSAPPVTAVVEISPPPSAAVLPPVDMRPMEMTAPAVTALTDTTADVGETAQAVAFGEVIELTESAADTEADAAAITRAEALVRATNATADAIDDIVAAAAEAMAEAAAAAAITAETAGVNAVVAELPIAQIAFGEAGPAAKGPVEAGLPEVGFVAAGLVEATTAEAEVSIAPAIGDVTPVAVTSEPLTLHAEDQTEHGAATVGGAHADGFVAAPMAPAAHKAPDKAITDPSQNVWDNALTAIMALSEEERLALFT